MVVKDDKSGIVRTNRDQRQLTIHEVQGLLFRELPSIRLLGLQMDEGPVMGRQQAHLTAAAIAKRTQKKLKAIANTKVATLATLMRIFNEIAISICAYSIPHARLEDNPLEQLQTRRTKLLAEYLSLPADIPQIIQAELGLKNIHAEAAEIKLRMINKIYNNREDTLTNNMLTWQTRESDPTSTKLAQTAALLTRNGSSYNIQQFLYMPYKMAKKHAKELTNRTNIESYKKDMIKGSATTKRLLTIKAHWGLESALADCPLYQARTYILA